MTSTTAQKLMAVSSGVAVITLFDITYKRLVNGVQQTEVYHVCNNKVDYVFNNVTYYAANVLFQPPDTSAGDQGAAKLSICTIDQTFPELVLTTTEAPIFRAHTVVDLESGTSEEIAAWDFELQNITWDNFVMTADLIYETLLDTEVPGRSLDATNFPGCY